MILSEKDPTEEKTVVVKKVISSSSSTEPTRKKPSSTRSMRDIKSIFDPELEEILRETEGYELTPQDEDGEPEYEEEPEYDESESDTERIIREQSEHRAHKKEKKLIIVCVAIVAVFRGHACADTRTQKRRNGKRIQQCIQAGAGILLRRRLR